MFSISSLHRVAVKYSTHLFILRTYAHRYIIVKCYLTIAILNHFLKRATDIIQCVQRNDVHDFRNTCDNVIKEYFEQRFVRFENFSYELQYLKSSRSTFFC